MLKTFNLCASLLVLISLAAHGVGSPTRVFRAAVSPVTAGPFVGRWRVKFTIGGLEKNLVLVSQARGMGLFQLLDTGPDDKPVATPAPAVWSQLTNDRVSFSGEAEMPIGTCCREIGTLIFKGKFTSKNSISGKLVFITSVDEDESPNKLRSLIGTFTATRLQDQQP